MKKTLILTTLSSLIMGCNSDVVPVEETNITTEYEPVAMKYNDYSGIDELMKESWDTGNPLGMTDEVNSDIDFIVTFEQQQVPVLSIVSQNTDDITIFNIIIDKGNSPYCKPVRTSGLSTLGYNEEHMVYYSNECDINSISVLDISTSAGRSTFNF